MAENLLSKVYEGAKYMSIQLHDVEEILSNEEFTTKEGLLTTIKNAVSNSARKLNSCCTSFSLPIVEHPVASCSSM